MLRVRDIMGGSQGRQAGFARNMSQWGSILFIYCVTMGVLTYFEV
jgi:hypothetical protein